jgi:type VI secretion system FHA domain protein
MLAALSVISANGAGLGPMASKVFDARGGSIGRLDNNDWTLPDPSKFVSSRHAVLSCDAEGFHVEDTSTNGTFVNGLDRRVPKNERVRLQDGDRIYIGDYEILVQLIEDEPQAGAPPEAPPPPLAHGQPFPGTTAEVVRPVSAAETLAPLADILSGGYAPSLDSAPPAALPASAAGHVIPNDWRTVLPAQPAPLHPALPPPLTARAPQPSPPPAVRRDTASPVAAPRDPQASGNAFDLLEALGLDPARVNPAIYQQLGLIVRIVVEGMIQVLQSRAEVKNNFRMPMTSIRPVENNPLKFSLNADDALHNLFVKLNPGYLGALEAFQEGFQDIAFHQMAMLAGIRAAFDAMLEKLNPESLEEVYQRKLRRTATIHLGGTRSKFWEMFRAQFEDYTREREASFQSLFGEEFAKAYHEQLQRLAAAARLGSR